jgi:arylsulfatase A
MPMPYFTAPNAVRYQCDDSSFDEHGKSLQSKNASNCTIKPGAIGDNRKSQRRYLQQEWYNIFGIVAPDRPLVLKMVGLLVPAIIALTVPHSAFARNLHNRPNIIVILADDMGIESVGSYGSEIDTPNLSRLANTGLQVANAHAMPLCTPSRVRLLTGRENSRNFRDFGHLDEREQTFAQVARTAGYRTLVAGKWQLASGWEPTLPLLGASPGVAGFDDYIVHNLTRQEVGSRYWGPTLYRNGERLRVEDKIYGSDLVNAHVLDFIGADHGKPFLIFYSMFEPHDPFVLTPGMEETADIQARYRGMVRYMDLLVGRVIDRVSALGLRKDTLIVFTSDNGNDSRIVVRLNGEPRRGGKEGTTRAATHVPFIASWPGVVPQGSRSAALVDIADIAPTIADLVGGALRGPVDGRSLIRLLRDPTSAVHDTIVHTYMPTGLTPPVQYAFDERYKLFADGRFLIAQGDGSEAEVTKPDNASQRAHERLTKALGRFRK